jgi:hypothetical protein
MNQTQRQSDGFNRWAQISPGRGTLLVRLAGVDSDNTYHARAIEFDADGGTQTTGDLFPVLNLAEPAGLAGQLPDDTEAVAIDVEGRWVIFVRLPGTAACLAKVTAAQGAGAYTVLEQISTGLGQFADKPDAATLTAYNLAEHSLGPGTAVDVGTLVFISTITQSGTPPTLRYVFDHPVYAKYLD